MKLTKAVIDKAKFSGTKSKDGVFSRCMLWDDAIPGFGVRIFPSGKKAFVVFYRAHGRSRLMTVGRYGILTLDQARELCREILVRVAKGEDPLAEKQIVRQADTFGEFWESYLEMYAKQKKRSWREDEMRFKRCIPEAWRGRKLSSVTARDIEELHFKIGKRSNVEANRTLALISKMYSFARLPNPTKGIQKFEEVKRDRWLTQDEILKLKDAIALEPNGYMRALIWLYLYTGVRKSELLKAKWTEIDLAEGTLFLKKTKRGNAFTVSLSEPAIVILQNLPRQAGNPYVFPGGKAEHHLVNVYKPWKRIMADSGLEGVQIRDLRRSFASMQVQSGMSLQLVSKLLNHSNTRTTEIYAHLADQQSRDAVESHGESLKRLIGEVKP